MWNELNTINLAISLIVEGILLAGIESLNVRLSLLFFVFLFRVAFDCQSLHTADQKISFFAFLKLVGYPDSEDGLLIQIHLLWEF
jgi:hypothetical protein